MKRSIALVLLLAALPVAAAAQGAKRRLTLEDHLRLESVSDPQISPDGRTVVYTRGWVDLVNDTRESSLWIVSAEGTRNHLLAHGRGAVWSPDGTRVAYLAKGEPRGTQIFVKYVDGNAPPSQVTRVDETPADLAWSPDGRSIAFTMLVPDRSQWTVKLPERPEGAKWTEAPRIIDEVVYRRDGRGFLEQGHTHLFVVPADGGAPRQVTRGDFNHGAPSWTPDGRTLVFSALLRPDADRSWRESEIYAVEVASGSTRQITSRKGPDYAPALSPDGRHVAYLGYDSTSATYRDADLYVVGIDGGAPRLLTGSFDRAPAAPFWAADGKQVLFNVESEGSTNLYAASLSGAVRPVTRGTHALRTTSQSRGGVLVGVRSDPHRPFNVVRFTPGRPEPQPITRINDDLLAQIELGEVEELWYTAPDGLRIQGWIVKPPRFDPSRKYPLQLHIHGGPHSMYGIDFKFDFQEHAANDYVVLYTNPRGSTGYGSDFGNAIKNAYPGKDYDDLMAGVDATLAKGYVDPQRMFVTGCSGGGVLTAWIVGKTDRFRAASVRCPVTNWLSFVGTTDGVSWYRNFEKFPWEDPSEHLRRSPLMYVGNVKTPTLLMTGVNDLRTPMPQTEEYYQALQVRGVPTAMIRFNDEWHGTGSKPTNFLRTQLYLRSWFERWGSATPAQSAR